MKDLFVDVRTRERPVVLYYFAKNGIVRWSVYGSFDYFELRKKKKLPEENWTLLTQTEENVFIDSGMACSDEYKLSVVLDGREVAYAVFPAIEEEATSSGFPLSSAGYRILDILPSVFNAHKNHVSKTKLNLLANTLGLGIDSTTKEIYRNMDAGSFAFFDPYGIDSYSFVSKTGDSVSVNGEEFFESRSVVPDSYSYEGRIFRFPFAETKAFSSWHISRTCAVRYQDFIDYLAFGYDWTKNEIKVLAYLTNEPVGRITLPGSENVSFAAMHIFEDTVYVLDKASRSVLCFAKPPLPLLKRADGFVQVRAAEIRPEHRREPEFGIRGLPEEEVAEAHFAAGANQQVRLRQISRVEVPGDRFRSDRLGRNPASDDLPYGVHELSLAGVVDAQVQNESRVASGCRDCLPQGLRRGGREVINPAGGTQADVVLIQLVRFPQDGLPEKAHQPDDFVPGAVPVFRGEHVERQHFDAKLRGGAHQLAHGFHSMAVAGDPGEAILFRPSPVAVHDDGNVPGKVSARFQGGLLFGVCQREIALLIKAGHATEIQPAEQG